MADGDTRDQNTKHDASLNIYQRIHAVMCELPESITKDGKAEMWKNGRKVGEYEYVSHDAVTLHVRPALLKRGIMVIPTIVEEANDGNRTQLGVDVSFVNVDQPDDKITIRVVGYGADTQDKGPGKAFSYAMKYAYLKTFLLPSGDDIEAHDIEHDSEKITERHLKQADIETRKALENWANNYKAALNGAKSVKELNEIERANKDQLLLAPDVTREFFIEHAQKRKAELEADA